jgi:hypothetical protein
LRRKGIDPEKKKATARRIYLANREKLNDPARHRNRNLKTRHGITTADFDRILAEQGGRCAICGIPEPQAVMGRLHVDHCHCSGRVRGLLCFSCNTGIGKLGDTSGAVYRAFEYLKSKEQLGEITPQSSRALATYAQPVPPLEGHLN